MNQDTASARCLTVQGLSTRYGERIALNAVSFELAHGCLAVLLGPNGAGKSTLFQVLTGLFAADAGDQVARFNPFTHAVEWMRFALYGKDAGWSPAVVLGALSLCFALATWGYNPQHGFGALTQRGGGSA
jgi:energy-coupling factor transporter ATP-binding protein EcfA2